MPGSSFADSCCCNLLCSGRAGFFYALVVVPIGTDELGGATDQGFITRRVTVWLNYIGGGCLLAYAVDSTIGRYCRRLRQFLCIASIIILLVLFSLHNVMNGYLNPDEHIIIEKHTFYRLHAIYLILSGVQWMVMLAAIWLMLAAWRAADVECRHTKQETP